MKKMFAQVVIMVTALFFVVSFFMTPVSVRAQETDEQNQTNPAPISEAEFANFSPQTAKLPVCGIGITSSGGSLEGCIVRGIYYFVLYPSSWLASIGGNIFDWFIAYTLNSNSYSQSGFVEQGWRIVRDIANLSFIFVLLYIAFRYVLGLEGRDVQKTLIKIIGVALILNFSLFATRVIVDAGNILGRVFYENISNSENSTPDQASQQKPISVFLIDIVGPQKLLSSNAFAPNYDEAAGANTQIGNLTNSASDGLAGSIGYMILILLLMSAVNLILAYVFFSVTVFLVARTVGLWMQMVFSPLAFLSIGIPKVGSAGGGRFAFSTWFSTTINLSFMVVVFLFLLYLTIMFLNVAFSSLVAETPNATGLTLFLEVLIPFVVVILLLLQAKEQAKKMAGEFGDAVVKGLKTAVVAALAGAGLAAGGAALLGGVAGRQVIGRLGAKMANKNATTAWGRAQKRAGKYLSTASFDARNIKIPKPVTSALRSGLSYATGNEIAPNDFRLRLAGKGTTKGGLETRRQKYVEDKLKDAQNLAPDKNTNMKTTYIDNNQQTQNININLNDATRNLERKKLAISRSENYDAKKRDQEKIHKDYEQKRKAYELAKRKLDDGSITQQEYDQIKNDFNVVEQQEKAQIDAEIKRIESQWKEEEKIMNAVKNALGAAQADHYRDYSSSIGTFDPRNRATSASEAVEDLAYKQDQKNQQNQVGNQNP